jgi:uncharacterized membrane protein (UPF0127 family)
MKNKLLLLLILIFLVGGVLFFLSSFFNRKPQYNDLEDFKNMSDRQLQTIKIGEKELLVEIVNSNESRGQGLSGRETIGGSNQDVRGMLFVFPQRSYQQFWMKDMKFDLDFIWIRDGKVVEIMRNVPKPLEGQSLEELPRFVPKTPVEMMLEVVAGSAEEWGVEVGSEVSH